MSPTEARDLTAFGVKGRYHGATIGNDSGTWQRQTWTCSKVITYHGEEAHFRVNLRFDDEFGNGHNTFAATAEVRSLDKRRRDNGLGFLWDSLGGAFHE